MRTGGRMTRIWPSAPVLCSILILLCAVVLSMASVEDGMPLGCQMIAPKGNGAKKQCLATSVPVTDTRVIAIGDIHGEYAGLLEDLFYANITSDRHACTWRPQQVPTVLVQMGDMVDRGPGALETMMCLRSLQKEAPQHNAKVVRLIGNHELWWLTGLFHDRHKQADTPDKIRSFWEMLTTDIKSGAVQMAYLHRINGVPLVFVHAGYNPKFIKYLAKQGAHSAEEIVNHAITSLRTAVSRCTAIPCKTIKGELYDAGPDRGGAGIGGPLWTDFGTLESAVNAKQLQVDFLQIVGHTPAFCYQYAQPGVHPPVHQAECARGLIRRTANMSVTCVDGGMYMGARAFLEIGLDGHMRSYERRGNEHEVPWAVKDLTSEVCGKYRKQAGNSSCDDL